MSGENESANLRTKDWRANTARRLHAHLCTSLIKDRISQISVAVEIHARIKDNQI